jgi:hypothetical protein
MMALSVDDVRDLALAGDPDTVVREGGLHGPEAPVPVQTAKQRDAYREGVERERDECAAAGDVDGLAACDAELQRLSEDTTPVADDPAPVESGRRSPFESGAVVRDGGLFGEPLEPASVPQNQLERKRSDYIASVRRERDKYAGENDANGVRECDLEIARAEASPV